ncbi:MAG: ATP-dependent helicase [Nanobdellota archaeon]
MFEFKKNLDSNQSVERILDPIVKKWFFSKFKKFSEPQRSAVIEINSRKNILVSAPTGATKTLTAFLAILNELVNASKKKILEDKVYCVYVSPLKALNNDIKANLLEPLSEIEDIMQIDLGIRVDVRTGDTTTKERTKQLKKPPHILITTPESLGIILNSPKFREHLKSVDWFIADEIHALADNKRGVHLSLSMERLSHLSSHMTRIGLSATVAPLERVAGYLVGNRNCLIVDIKFKKKMDLRVVSAVEDLINTTPGKIHDELYKKLHNYIKAHKTTLIFTNTRAATERVVDNLKEKFPKFYGENIGAHHGSLSAEHRKNLENNLKKGNMRAVVCSTSLELGIDIGSIDLVVTLGSPKSVSRALQRIGRSGHSLNSMTKGRIIVLERDDLVECSILLKAAIEKKIDKINVPKNSLDVLAQHIYGMAIADIWQEKELYKTITKSYCFSELTYKDFQETLAYLAGEFASLEDRNVYAKIWRKNGQIGKRGKLARVIYMTNIGTIPDQTEVKVKQGSMMVGTINEGFLERLRPGDVFILGGNRFIFKYSRGMVAQVNPSADRPPTVPSWVSEMLPLSFDLAKEIQKFRRLMEEKFLNEKSKKEIINFLNDYLYIDKNSAEAIYYYFFEQYHYLKELPHDKKLIIESYQDEKSTKIIFHSLYGRRVNDVLSRAIGYAITKGQHRDVEIGINDNGFYLGVKKKTNITNALKLIKSTELTNIMENALDGSEILKRRFRHCAGRSLMILRSYMGRKKRVGRQQVSSMLLLSAVKRISKDFPILKEAKREVLKDQMDIVGAKEVIQSIEKGHIKISEITTQIPSPFAFNIAMQGVMDVVKMEDKMAFLQRMHNMVLAKISLKTKTKKKKDEFDYYKIWEQHETENEEKQESYREELKILAQGIDEPVYIKEALHDLIDGETRIKEDIIIELNKKKEIIKNYWPEKLKTFTLNKLKEL